MQLESDAGSNDLQALDLSAFIKSLIEDHRLSFENAKVDLVFNGGKNGAVPVIGSAVLIEEILSNLLDNTLQHAQASKVVVAVEEEGAVLRVTDDGVGVAQNSLDWVFERFFKAGEHSGSGSGSGSVRGLSIVREFASRMAAEAQAESRDGLSGSIHFRAA